MARSIAEMLESLAEYISADDGDLDQIEFLATIADRIEEDLDACEPWEGED